MIDVVAPQHLDALGRFAIRLIDALPRRNRLRLAPTQLAHRRGRERHAEIGAYAAVEDLSRYRPAVDDDRVFRDRAFDNLGARMGDAKKSCDADFKQDCQVGQKAARIRAQTISRPLDDRVEHAAAPFRSKLHAENTIQLILLSSRTARERSNQESPRSLVEDSDVDWLKGVTLPWRAARRSENLD